VVSVGGVAEWSIAPVLKTGVSKGTVSSNLTPSAKMEELELTYLVKDLPEGVLSSPSKELLDIYIPASVEHPTLRVRKAGEKCEITKKQPIEQGDASRQLEITIPLTKNEFEELNTLMGKRVQKTRFYYKEQNVSYEIDVFRGDLSGLVLADVEFSSIEEKGSFKMPSWCLADVTQEDFIAGGMICGKEYSDVEEVLSRFGYKKLII
jgi:CYTH domain-containing protein